MNKELEKELRLMKNTMTLEFDSISSNERFARIVVAAFLTQMDPNMEELADVKTAVSEAVTNSIIHGYEDYPGKICLGAEIRGNVITLIVEDEGKGIEDVEQAMEPLYTTKPDMERSGMGFSFMEAFMDELIVESELHSGTKITMRKVIGK